MYGHSTNGRFNPTMDRDDRTLVITGESLLKDIADAFSRWYPYLAMEFFLTDHGSVPHQATRTRQDTDVKVFAGISRIYTLELGVLRIVSSVAQEVSALTGLHVRICRKSGRVWNAVSLTDGWTLDRQNTAGEMISKLMEQPAVNGIPDTP